LGGGVYDAEPWTNISSVINFEIIDPSVNPLPLTQNISRWTNLNSIIVNVDNGYFMPHLSNNTMLVNIQLLFSQSNITAFLPNTFRGLNLTAQLLVSTGASGITTLPSIADMVSLTRLNLHNNNLTTLPDSFRYLTALTTVYLDNNVNLVLLPSSMKYCVSLSVITNSNTKLVYQNSWFDMRQTRVDFIEVDGLNLMTVLPDGFCQLPQNPLTVTTSNVTLRLFNTALTTLPACFSENPFLGNFLLSVCSQMSSFPSVVFDLPYIQTININNCPISSPFPTVPAMPSLTSVRFFSNGIPGAFPTSLFLNNPLLDLVDLSNNWLAGSIPDNAFLQSTALSRLNIDHNMLSGAFPSSICAGPIGTMNLGRLVANHNRFSSLPTVWTGCDGLTMFDLSDNWLTSIPNDTEWAGLLSLKWFLIGGNYNLKGNLPRFWTTTNTILTVNASSCSFHNNVPALNSNTLDYVYLYDNRLNGSIEDPISASQIRDLRIDRNNLAGSINGSAIWTLTSLLNLDISYNQFSGILPPTLFTNLPRLITFNFNNNGFSGDIPNMLGVAGLSQVYGQENFLELCNANPNIPSYATPSTYLFYNELFSYGSCNCTSWYSNALTNSTCPAPGFVQGPVSIPPPPTPIMAPPPTLPIDPVAPPSLPVGGSGGAVASANTVSFSVVVLLAVLALWVNYA